MWPLNLEIDWQPRQKEDEDEGENEDEVKNEDKDKDSAEEKSLKNFEEIKMDIWSLANNLQTLRIFEALLVRDIKIYEHFKYLYILITLW